MYQAILFRQICYFFYKWEMFNDGLGFIPSGTIDYSGSKRCLRGHRVAGSFPCLNTTLKHFDVAKAFRPVFGCLTDSARVSESRSIENDFLRLRQRSQPRP